MSPEILHRREGVLEARVSENELVLLGPDAQDYFGLDAIGADVWERLARPAGFEDLVQDISQDYDASPERIAADLRPVIEALVSGGLLDRRTA